MTDRKIVANIVGRNEEPHYLREVLNRLTQQVDLITFTDDHSDDDTAAIAESYGARIQVMDEPTFRTNEGKLRQASWDFLSSHIEPSSEWFVLAIDCDEMLFETKYSLHDLANQDDYHVVNVEFYHMWSPTHFRYDKAWRPHGSSRFFRYIPNGVFQNRNLACGSEPTYVQELMRQRSYMIDSGLVMKHLSYIKDEDKQAKFDRYAAIDGGAFHAGAHIQSILDTEPSLSPFPWEDVVSA